MTHVKPPANKQSIQSSVANTRCNTPIGSARHVAKDPKCLALNKLCRNCNKKRHFSSLCRFEPRTAAVNQTPAGDDKPKENEYMVFSVYSDHKDSLYCTVKLDEMDRSSVVNLTTV